MISPGVPFLEGSEESWGVAWMVEGLPGTDETLDSIPPVLYKSVISTLGMLRQVDQKLHSIGGQPEPFKTMSLSKEKCVWRGWGSWGYSSVVARLWAQLPASHKRKKCKLKYS